MVAAITKLGWTHLSCFGHNLNLAVTNSMKDEDRITRAVGVCKKVVQHFAHSWKKHSFTEAQVAKGFPHHTLVTDCLEQDAAIRMVLSDDRKTIHMAR